MSTAQPDYSEILVHASVRGDSYDVLLPWFKSIGFQTQSLKYAHTDTDCPSLAQEYLVNARCHRDDPETENSVGMYLSEVGLTTLSFMGNEDIENDQIIPLPKGPALEMELGHAITQRRSIRSYTGDAVGLDYLATILRAGNGITAEATAPLATGGDVKLLYRTAPSAGGLYPIDIYIGALNVKGLDQGIYRYHSKLDSLVKYLPNPNSIHSLLQACAFSEEMLSCSRANAILLLVARPWKTMRKYGNRGLKFVYQEAGSISQNIHLAASSLGLGTVDCAGFYDNDIHKLMNIDGVTQALIHVVVLGVPG